MIRPILPAVFVSLACVFLAAHAGEAPKLKMSAEEKRILELTNAERKKNDLAPVEPSEVLFKLARGHSANMAKQGKLAHDLDGKTPFDRMKDAGYRALQGSENVAVGDADIPIAEIFQGWMASESHRRNILDKMPTEIGIGLAKAKDGNVYYTQVFGKPRAK